MRILLLEDDHQHAKYIEITLKQRFPDLEIDPVETEKEFRDQLAEIVNTGYDVVMLDVMAPWTRPTRDLVPPPQDVKEEGFFRAGLRCYELLKRSSEELASRVIFFTLLEVEALRLPEGTKVFSKKADPDLKDLITEIECLRRGS